MPLFKTKFHVEDYFVNVEDNREHPLKEVVSPLTPAQMLRRSLNGQPISCHNYSQEERIIFQKRFFGLADKMDVIDSCLKASKDFDQRRKASLDKLKQSQQQPQQPQQQPQQPQQQQ